MSNLSRKDLMELAQKIVAAESGSLRLAHNEEDKTKKVEKEAAHFIKFKEERLGRDIELYGFMAEGPVGWPTTLTFILEEVIMPLKKKAPAAYAVACEGLKKFGEKVFEPNMRKAWKEILAS